MCSLSYGIFMSREQGLFKREQGGDIYGVMQIFSFRKICHLPTHFPRRGIIKSKHKIQILTVCSC